MKLKTGENEKEDIKFKKRFNRFKFLKSIFIID